MDDCEKQIDANSVFAYTKQLTTWATTMCVYLASYFTNTQTGPRPNDLLLYELRGDVRQHKHDTNENVAALVYETRRQSLSFCVWFRNALSK